MSLRDENGASYHLGQVLGRGGEAVIHEIARQPTLVAKIYHSPAQDSLRKLRAMVAQPPDDPSLASGHVSICWPRAVLFDGSSFAGFLMPRLDRSQYREAFKIFNPKNRRVEAPNFTWAYLVAAAENIATVVASIHQRGYVIGDLNESNFFISTSARATIVDCDSMQVSTPSNVFRCTVAKPEYLAPELHGVDLGRAVRNEAQDNFALSVLLFQFLMEGNHPYSGVWRGSGDPPPLDQRIAQGDSPYGGSARVTPPPYAPRIDILPIHLQQLFVRSFSLGSRDPLKRPSATEWQQALSLLGSSLATCSRNRQHRYSNHLPHCPWCERSVLFKGLDPFPSTPQKQPAAPRPAARPSVVPPPPRPTSRFSPAGSLLRALESKIVLRLLTFLAPFLSAGQCLLLAQTQSFRSAMSLPVTFALMCIAGSARLFQLRRFLQALGVLALGGFLTNALYRYSEAFFATRPNLVLGLIAVFAFAATRWLVRFTSTRLEIYRLHSRTRPIAWTLAAAIFGCPFLSGAIALESPRPAPIVTHFVAPLAPSSAPPFELLTCARIQGTCGCEAKNRFRPGERVNLLATSSGLPPFQIQLTLTNQPAIELPHTRWHTNGTQHCATSHYQIPAQTPAGFAHLSVTVGDRTQQTGFSVVP